MDRQRTANPAELFELDGCQYKLTKAAADETYELQIPIQITAENIEGIVVDALECCSTYWVGLDNTTPEWAEQPEDLPASQYAAALLLCGKTVKLYDIEDEDETWELTLDKLLMGIRRELTNGWKVVEIIDDADAALQYALFGEIIYG